MMNGKDIEKKWLKAFTKDVNEESLKKYVYDYGNYLWHIFSWELVPCIEGDEARRAFDKEEYEKALFFRSGYADNGAIIEDLKEIGKISAKELERIDDVYITAEDFSWTYVHTHEEMCGPYFFKKVDNYEK